MPEAGPATLEVAPAALFSFVAYLLLIVAIGVWSARFSSGGTAQFYLAGRSLGHVVVALSAVVSGRSAWLLVGFTGIAYQRGASAVWAAVGYIAVEAVLFLAYAPRLRRFAEAHDCITLPDFFSARFGGTTRAALALRGLTVVVILLFMVSYVAAQFVAGGKSFASSFGFEPFTGILVTAAIVLAYTCLGGFLAVSLTDVVQACLMLVALVTLPLFAVRD
ncbi:MAG: sodium/proline symporter, partial [Acidobacteriota bacterium]|nr:sodium/proline symporter [Acidobacteriota bacterium]